MPNSLPNLLIKLEPSATHVKPPCCLSQEIAQGTSTNVIAWQRRLRKVTLRFTSEVGRRLFPETRAVRTAGFVDTFKQRNGPSQLPSNNKKQRPIPCQNRQAKYLIHGSSRAGLARIAVSKASFPLHPRVSFRSKKMEDVCKY